MLVLVFDGRSVASMYMVAIVAYPNKKGKGYENVLLSFSTFEEEVSYKVVEHLQNIEYVLDCYKTHEKIL